MDPHERDSPVQIEGVWLQNKMYEQAVPAGEKLRQPTAPKVQIKNKNQTSASCVPAWTTDNINLLGLTYEKREGKKKKKTIEGGKVFGDWKTDKGRDKKAKKQTRQQAKQSNRVNRC